MADETVEKTEETAGASEGAVAGDSAAETAESVVEDGGDVTEAGSDESPEAPVVETETETAVAEPAIREAVAITPDIGFVKDIIKGGGADLKKCMQCANCSCVCEITPESMPFPRKEMMWAQWGLKEKLVGSPDIWLCHQCNDCTAQCPRDAKPGHVMQAIAKMTIPTLSKPGFLAKGVGSPSALLLMLAIPLLIVALTIGIMGDFSPARGEIVNGEVHHQGEIVYNSFLGHWPIVGVFSTFFVLSIIILGMGVRNYWGMMKLHAANEGMELNSSGMAQIGPVISEIAAHKRFGKCEETSDRKVSHLFIFYAFGLLFAATIVSTLFTDLPLLWGGEGILSPYPTISFVKLFGYSGAIAGIVGIGLITINRFKHQEKVGVGSYFDWLLIGLIVVLMLTGIGSAAFRKLDVGVIAYPTYFVHLVAVLFLFIYAPFSKMAHMVYRTTAMAFARATGRDTPM